MIAASPLLRISSLFTDKIPRTLQLRPLPPAAVQMQCHSSQECASQLRTLVVPPAPKAIGHGSVPAWPLPRPAVRRPRTVTLPPARPCRAARRAHPALLSGAPAIWPSQPKFLQLCTQVLAQKGALHKRRPVPKRCVCVCCCCFVVRITYIVLHTLERNHRGTRSHACHRAAAARAGQLPFLFSLESLNVARRVEAQWYPPLRVVLLAIIWGLLPSVTAPHQHTPLAAWRNWPQRLVSWDEWRDPLLLHLPRE